MANIFGSKTSRSGIDVKTAKTTDLQFTTTNPGLKIYSIINMAVKIPANEAALTVTKINQKHNFIGGTPAYLPFVTYNNIAYPIQTNQISAGGVGFQFDSSINSSDINILIYHASQAPASDTFLNFKIFVFTNRLA